MSLDLLIALCGAWGLSGSLAWSFARSRRAMLAIQICTAPGFALHYALQSLWTAAGLVVLSILLNVTSAFLEGPRDSLRVRLARGAYLVALVPVATLMVLSWAGPHSFFAALGVTIACIGRWQTDPNRFRFLLLFCVVPWFAHNVIVGSLPGIASDVFLFGRGIWLAAQTRLQRRRRAPALARPSGRPLAA